MKTGRPSKPHKPLVPDENDNKEAKNNPKVLKLQQLLITKQERNNC